MTSAFTMAPDLTVNRMGYGAMQLAAADLALPGDAMEELDAL
jgi:hypothetical protein